MAMFYGINSSTSSNFFNNMLGTKTNSTIYQSLTTSLSDYAAIKNGSYRKLVKAYYAQQAQETEQTTSKTQTSTGNSVQGVTTTAQTEKKQLVELNTKADALKTSADVLMERGTNSIFKKVETKDEDGNVSSQYDVDKIYKAVKQFVSDYNNLVAESQESTNSSILRKGVNLIQDMAVYEDSFQDIGITIQEDNTLSIDEEAFKNADMTDVKSVFNGSVSATAKAYQKAADIYNLSTSAASSQTIYNGSAVYASSLTGTLYNSYL